MRRYAPGPIHPLGILLPGQPKGNFRPGNSGIAQWQSRRLVCVRREFDSRFRIQSGLAQSAEPWIRIPATPVQFRYPDPSGLGRKLRHPPSKRIEAGGLPAGRSKFPRSSSSSRISRCQREDTGANPVDRSKVPAQQPQPLRGRVRRRRGSLVSSVRVAPRGVVGGRAQRIVTWPITAPSYGTAERVRGASSMGELWSCKPAMRVRFPRIPPGVAVAEPGFRRLAVNQSYVGSNPTGHPTSARSSDGRAAHS